MEIIETTVGLCNLNRSRRRTLAISVLPDGTVEIVAPRTATLPAIQAKIVKRSGWIRRQQRFFTQLRVERPMRRYCTGATHRYLGRQYRLKVTNAQEPGVKLRGAYLHVAARSGKTKEVAALITAWMRKRAREQFDRRLIKWREWCDELGLPKPNVFLRDMPKRWGSAHSTGRIYLNPELVRAPSPCIEYVIAHEICHLKHPKHNRSFYAVLEQLCPNWRDLKYRLETTEL